MTSSKSASAIHSSLVPTLRVGMPSLPLCGSLVCGRPDAGRRRRHSHAERGNEGGSRRASRGGAVLIAILVISWVIVPRAACAEDISSKVDEYMQARVAKDRFNGSILLARDGKVLVHAGYGMANLEHDVPNTPETKFRLGSITKQFTAMAVMMLQEKGKLCVQEPIKTYLPDCPKTWDKITTHHLLTHTSGIPNYTSFPDFVKTMAMPTSLDALVARFKDKPLDFKPGEKFDYSNSGYVLLGLLIEKVSGKSYAMFLKENIFIPLGMHNTGYDSASPILKHRASGYMKAVFLTLNARPVDMSIPHAAGALYSTVDDLLLWDRALSGDKLVSKATLETIYTPYKAGYGYGWTVGKAFGHKMVAHGGGINGFVTYILRIPDEKLCVAVLSNVEGSPVAPIARDLAAIALGEKYTIPGKRKAIALDAKVLDTYIGTYIVDEPKLTFIVTRDGTRLLAKLNSQPKLEIFPESETSFFYKAVEAEITFVKDKAGKVTHLVLHQNGLDLKAKKQDPDNKSTSEKKP